MLSIGIPPKIKKSYKDVVSKEGDNIAVDLEVTGVPTPQVQWYHKDKPVENNEKFKVIFHSLIQSVWAYIVLSG